MRTTWTFHSAGRLVFGNNAILQLPQHLKELDAHRVLIVTDTALVSAGVVQQVRGVLEQGGITTEVFTEGCPEPPLDLAVTCAECARVAHADMILGLGGGSNMDLAWFFSIQAE